MCSSAEWLQRESVILRTRRFYSKGRLLNCIVLSATKEGIPERTNVKENSFWYRFQENKWKTFSIVSLQSDPFIRINFVVEKRYGLCEHTVAIRSRISCAYPGCVIYHLHETSMNPPGAEMVFKEGGKGPYHMLYMFHASTGERTGTGTQCTCGGNALEEFSLWSCSSVWKSRIRKIHSALCCVRWRNTKE